MDHELAAVGHYFSSFYLSMIWSAISQVTQLCHQFFKCCLYYIVAVSTDVACVLDCIYVIKIATLVKVGLDWDGRRV